MKTAEANATVGVPAWRTRLNDHLTNWVLPVGLLCLLTSMMWAGEKRLFQQLFYLFLALPAFILALNDRSLITALLRSPVFIAFLCFAAYFSISISWSGTDESTLSLLKRPLYVLCLFFAFAGVAFHRPDRLTAVLRLSSIIAVVAASVQLAFFLLSDDGARLAGYGALHNPLLTSHVFGFFLVLWIAYWIHQRRFFLPVAMIAVAVLGALILATGSRTPLLALSATIL
ncbi:MAG: ligase, partial [Betaproteobacteria bacterium HGW-Betaproteobacteria-19]